jgi:hypothetical protein
MSAMNCPYCRKQVNAESVYCEYCGKELPKMNLAGDVVAVSGSTVIKAGSVIYEGSSAWKKTDECPICGKINLPTETFRCKKCQRTSICLSHQNKATLTCFECSSGHIDGQFLGTCTNTTLNLQGQVLLSIHTGASSAVTGRIDFFGGLGGGGEFSGTKNGSGIEMEYVDKTYGLFKIAIAFSADGHSITGHYTIVNSTQSGAFSAQKIEYVTR